MAHLARTRETPNANPDQRHNNVWLIGSADMDLVAMISCRFKQLGIKPRRNAVIANDVVLTISRFWFAQDGRPASEVLDQRKVRVFQRVALTFVKEQFGDRLLAAVLHVDERTPHLQVVLIPTIAPNEADGQWRLSARDLFSPASLRALQQAWEDKLKPYGVGKRTIRSRTRHVDAQQYGGTVADVSLVTPIDEIGIRLPPSQKMFETASGYKDRAGAWRDEEERRLKHLVKPLLGLAVEGKLTHPIQRANIELRSRLKQAQRDLECLNHTLAEARRELNCYTPPSSTSVAEVLGLSVLEPDTPPIAAVMLHRQLGRYPAMAFLVQKFGVDATASAVRNEFIGVLSKLQFDVEPADERLEKADTVNRIQPLAFNSAGAVRFSL